MCSCKQGMLPQTSIKFTLLKFCRERGPSHAAYMHRSGLESLTSLGNQLISISTQPRIQSQPILTESRLQSKPILIEPRRVWISTEPISTELRAQRTFDNVSYRNDWSVIIGGYLKSGKFQHALHLYQELQMNGSSLHLAGYTFVGLLKASATLRDLDAGLRIHAEVARTGYLRNCFVGSTLVDVYIQCGSLTRAQEVFDGLLLKDVVAWTTLMAGYTEHGCAEEALACFDKMQLDGASPDARTFVCILKACSSIRAVHKGENIHAELERLGMVEENLFVASTLVDLYAKCGLLVKAQEVFDRCPYQNIVLWNALLSGYAEHGYGEEALQQYEQMQLIGFSPSSVSYVCALKACGSIGAVDKGREIHVEIERRGLLEGDVVVGNTLVDMYARCGVLILAQQVFIRLPSRDVVSWTALISGYVEHGRNQESLQGFEMMQLDGIFPNAATFVCILKACGNVRATSKGREVHTKSTIRGFMDSAVSNAVVSMYSKCGMFSLAQHAFDKLQIRDVVSWTALIVGYVEHGHGQKALQCYEKMRQQGVYPNAITIIYILKACGCIGSIEEAGEVCAEVERQRLLETNVDVGNALVDMYAKCNFVVKAQEVFDKLPVRDGVSWGTLILVHAEHGNDKEALKCFEQMQLEGTFPRAITYACVLKACGNLGVRDRGKEIHVEIEKRGLLETNPVIGNNLVNMYAKFGLLAKAQHVFERLPVRDLVAWNALIGGYAWLGESKIVFSLYDQMQRESLKPDVFTFIVILSACSRTGLSCKSDTHFEIMSKEYGLVPNCGHYTWMIDLLGRLGQLDMAIALIRKMPYCPYAVWHVMLGACCSWGSLELGKEAFKQTVQ